LNKSNALTNKEQDPEMVDWTAVIVLRGEPMTSGFVRLWRHVLAVTMLVAATAAGGAATAGWVAYQRGDFAAARAAYEHDARLGDRLAQFNLATMLLRGEGGAADAAAGVEWLRKAAQAGMAQAQYNLGLLYESGTGVDRSLTAATEWWEKAAQQGHVDAQVQLGTQYFLGRGAPKDWALAARWYEAAAENGDPGAQYLIASFYEHGDGVAPDLKRALGWYLQAARQGDAGAALQADDVARRLGVALPGR
jgi:TPR repeat protein